MLSGVCPPQPSNSLRFSWSIINTNRSISSFFSFKFFSVYTSQIQPSTCSSPSFSASPRFWPPHRQPPSRTTPVMMMLAAPSTTWPARTAQTASCGSTTGRSRATSRGSRTSAVPRLSAGGTPLAAEPAGRRLTTARPSTSWLLTTRRPVSTSASRP